MHTTRRSQTRLTYPLNMHHFPNLHSPSNLHHFSNLHHVSSRYTLLDALKRASASLAALASELNLDTDKATARGQGLARGRAKGKKSSSSSSAADEMAEAEDAIYTTAAAIGSAPVLAQSIIHSNIPRSLAHSYYPFLPYHL